MKTDPKGNTVLFLKRVPAAVKKRFKAACDMAGHSMTWQLIQFMKEFADRKGVPPGKGGSP